MALEGCVSRVDDADHFATLVSSTPATLCYMEFPYLGLHVVMLHSTVYIKVGRYSDARYVCTLGFYARAENKI